MLNPPLIVVSSVFVPDGCFISCIQWKSWDTTFKESFNNALFGKILCGRGLEKDLEGSWDYLLKLSQQSQEKFGKSLWLWQSLLPVLDELSIDKL